MAGAPRLFAAGQVLSADRPASLTAGQGHYLRNVLRRRPGDPVLLFNGRDGEWLAAIGTLGKAGADAVVQRQTRPQPPDEANGPWLCFAPLKRGPVDLIAEKATELGVARLIPVTTRHTDAARVNTQRLAIQAVEAAEQCGRLTVPEVAAPVALPDLLAGWPSGRALLVCAESGAARPLLAEAVALAGQPVALLIGPEGGFAGEELDALGKLAFARRCHLGPRILRAETAAIAALSCWQAAAGDGRLERPAGTSDRALDDRQGSPRDVG